MILTQGKEWELMFNMMRKPINSIIQINNNKPQFNMLINDFRIFQNLNYLKLNKLKK